MALNEKEIGFDSFGELHHDAILMEEPNYSSTAEYFHPLCSNLKEQKKTKTNHGYIIVRSQHNWNSQNWKGSIASPDDEINRLIQQSRHMPIFSDPLCWYSFGYLLSIAALQSYLLYTRIHNKATMSIVKDQSNNKCEKNKKQTTAYHWINR